MSQRVIMQFRSSKIRLLTTNLNIVTQWCAEYILTLLHSIYLKWNSQQLVSELPDSTYRGSLKNVCVYLEFSLLDCLTTKKFQNFSKISVKFQDLPRTLLKFKDFPELTRTGGNHELDTNKVSSFDSCYSKLKFYFSIEIKIAS